MKPWVVLKCRFADVPTMQDGALFLGLFTPGGATYGGMVDYLRSQSAGGIEVDGAKVHGWFDLPVTLATARTWTWPDARKDLMQLAVTAAEPTVDLTQFDVIVVALNAVIDSGSAGRGPLNLRSGSRTFGMVNLDPAAWFPTFAAHELLHGYGLPHSYREDDALVGYGDGWDIMSAMTFGSRFPCFQNTFGTSGPALSMAYRDMAGWVPAIDILELSSYAGATTPITLLPRESGMGVRLIKIWLGSSTQYYSVELCSPIGWDAACGDPGVLVRRVQDGTSRLRPGTGGRLALQAGDEFVDMGEGIGIGVVHIAPGGTSATVHVTRRAAESPYVSATTQPAANTAGWHNTSPEVRIGAVAKPGGQIANIVVGATGANPIAPGIVTAPGPLRLPMPNAGRTTVVYAATDVSGAGSAPRTLDILIDKTPPVSGSHPAASGITLSASDNGGSGFDRLEYEVVGANAVPPTTTTRPQTAVDLSAPGQSTVFFWATDVAGNVEAPHTLDISPVADVTPERLDLVAVPGTDGPPGTLTLRNTGTAGLIVRSVETDDQTFVVRPDVTPEAVIAPGGSATITVVFHPFGETVVDGRVLIRTARPDRVIEVPVRGTGMFPRLDFLPAALTFPATRSGQTSAPATVLIRNPGQVPLRITRLTEDRDFAIVTGPPVLPLTLAPGGSCPVEVVFRPVGGGDIAGGLTVESDAPGAARVLALSGTGIPVPRATVTPSAVTFRQQPVGTTGLPRLLTVTNTGHADLVISDAVLSGTGSGQFTVVAPWLGQPVVLSPEKTAELEVGFRPTATGPHVAELRLDSNDPGPAQAVLLIGDAVPAPVVTIDPTAADFGAYPVGSPSPQRTLTVTNHGSAPIDIDRVRIDGDDRDDFQIVGSTCQGSVPPGGTCEIGVVFQASAVGTRQAQLLAGDAVSTHRAQLIGTGSGPLVEFDPPRVDFGALPLGGTDRRDVLIRNVGNAVLTISGLQTTGPYRNGPGCAFPFGPGSECRVRVLFQPTAGGPQNGELIVTDDALGSPHRLTLTGTGLVPGISIDTTALDFGSQQVGTVSGLRPIVVTSSGTAPLSIEEVEVTGPHAGDFRLQDRCGFRGHMPGATCVIEVAFAPVAAGDRTAVLTVRDSAAGSPRTISLTGVALGK